MSNLLWAYATLQQPAPALFAAVLPLLERRLPESTTQAISNSVWAAARLGLYDRALMDTVAEHIVVHRLQQLRPSELATLAWAYGELGHAHRPLLDGIVSCTVSYVWPRAAGGGAGLSLEVLAAVCSAASVFSWSYPALLDATARRLEALASADQQSRARVPHACTRTSAANGLAEALSGVAAACCCNSSNSNNSSSYRSGNVSVHARSMACEASAAGCAGHGRGRNAADPGKAAVVEEAGPQLYSMRDVANLAMALSLVGGCTPQLWARLLQLFTRAVEVQGCGIAGVPQEEHCQLYQVMWNLEGGPIKWYGLM